MSWAIDYAEKTDNRQPTKKPDGTPVNPDVDSANIDVKNKARLAEYNEQKAQEGYLAMRTEFELRVPYLYKNAAGGL